MIRKLPPYVIQNIAAGELVERPASILKELIENSIDAGAKQIKVEHEGGGLNRLCVTDDGKGIHADEFELVFESHATSKIQGVDDLSRIQTMGFRGEAMSSIASVARVKLWSGAENQDTSTVAEVHHGKWMGKSPADRRIGTEVEVCNLFEKLPARRKFLKSERAEARQLLQVFKRYALAHPEIKWQFLDDSKAKIQLGQQTLMERGLWYFDAAHPEQFFEQSYVKGQWSAYFVGLKPRYLQPNRQGIQCFLNRRPIKDRSLEFAVRRAFEGFAERPQEVVGALFLEGPCDEFDVNVHPAKTEVRFQRPQEVFSVTVHAVQEALDKIHLPEQRRELASETLGNGSTSLSLESARNLTIQPPHEAGATGQGSFSQSLLPNSSFESQYEFLGSIAKTFWLVKRKEQLYLFDQHALHERVLYEYLLKEVETSKSLNSQRLLFPITADFEGAEDLLENEELLQSLGFELRQWRLSGLQILAVPSILKKNHLEALRAIANCQVKARESFLREVLARLACHSALRAHDEVFPEQARKILSQFESDDALGHCPHGRPTFIRFDQTKLESFFHRG